MTDEVKNFGGGKGNLNSLQNISVTDQKIIDQNMDKYSVWLNQQLKDKPVPSEGYIELSRRANAVHENFKLQHMTENERKEYIMSKFLSARNANDKAGMFYALVEFYDYECSLLDNKFGITTAKNFIKDKTGLNNLVDYLDQVIDDGEDTNLSAKEKCWEVIKGVGDAIDNMIGVQGLTMVGGLGAATKAATLIPKVGPLVGGAIQVFFTVDGAVMLTEGSVQIANADNKTDARNGGAQAGMGAIMVGGTVKSVNAVKRGNSSVKNKPSENVNTAQGVLKAEKRAALKQKLMNANKVEIKYQENGDISIIIPKGKLRAPSTKFAETDEAFCHIVRLSKMEFLELNKLAGDDFIRGSFELLKKKMGLEGAPIGLEINNKNYSVANPETAKVEIGKNWKGGDKSELLGALAHELNHMFQYKEMYINSLLEGQNLKINQKFKDWIEGQPDFWEGHNQYFYDKARVYKDNFVNYIEPDVDYASYRRQPVEAEAHFRGDIVRDEFNKVVNLYKLDPLENRAIDIINHHYSGIDVNTRIDLLNVAVEHLKEPRFASTHVNDFVEWFFKEYPQ